ncbi:MAG: GTPase, partial [Planctomycetota bacterium]
MSAGETLRLEELTPPGHGAVSVVALRGAGARERVSAWMQRRAPRPGRARLAELHVDGDWLDEALVVCLGPEHFELHLHGSPAVLARLRRAARQASPPDPSGEPLDAAPLRSAAWRALAGAEGEHAARTLLDQAEGALDRSIARLERAEPQRAARGWRGLADRTRAAAPLFRLPRVVLAGEPNVGKSTLFNALVGEARALVADETGTTRDALELPGGHAGFAWRWIDTAGQGSGAATRDAPTHYALDELDRAGRQRARERLQQADLVLWCSRADADPAPLPVELAPTARWVSVGTQSDRLAGGALEARTELRVSALHEPLEARERVGAAVVAALELG